MQKASEKYHIKMNEPVWVEMKSESSSSDWVNNANYYLKEGKYDFVLYLIRENNNIYPKLKMHSLCTNGYVSQVVKFDTLYRKDIKNICSKILL